MNNFSSPSSDLPLAEHVADSLRAQIIEGDLRSDDRLRDQRIAADFNVSRNTVREAIRIMVHNGLATVRLNSGASVRRLEMDEIHDMYAVRRMLECAAMDHAASAPEELFNELARLVDEVEHHHAEGNWREAATLSLHFHQTIVRLARSPLLDAFFSNVIAQLRLGFAIMPDQGSFQSLWTARDREICDLIRGGQISLAKSALTSYLDDSESHLVNALRAQPRLNTTSAKNSIHNH